MPSRSLLTCFNISSCTFTLFYTLLFRRGFTFICLKIGLHVCCMALSFLGPVAAETEQVRHPLSVGHLTPLLNVCLALRIISSSPQLPKSSIILPPSGELLTSPGGWSALPLALMPWHPMSPQNTCTLARIWLIWIVHEGEKSSEYMFLFFKFFWIYVFKEYITSLP